MASMGRHNALINGHRGEDGAAAPSAIPPKLAPFAISPALQVQRLVPVPLPGVRQDGTVKPGTAERWRHAVTSHRGWLAAVPIVLVNAVAFAGQLAFLRTRLPWPAAGQALVAVTLESVAVYLAWQAHLALAADDSALRLRLAAYGFATVIGVLNYSHYMAPHWHPTFAAVTFGLMSMSSPWLWSVHSRRVSRDSLKARGLIEPHAVRLGATRWMWHPLRCVRVMSRATWAGENDPAEAIALPPAKAADVATDGVPDRDMDSDTEDDGDDADERHDDDETSDRDDEETDSDDQQDRDTNSDKKDPPRSPAGDKVAAVLRRSRRLRDLLASDSAADRKAAKEELAEKAGVSVRTVERAIRETAS